ncbi:hypothetical protein JCM16161A_15780 [Vulcanisaeta sp. JCM 16161]|uniref:hypothetical protein n=1 Tax=Vulcanisaeta sp. JCM 16161 TaxID=1295372 RepID=UPI0006CF829A|nr:hypothetical protein [Vulcanisaeta sp. JCM 16161]
MPRGKEVNELPYWTRIYINGQVLLPAMLVRALGIEWARYADIVIRHNGRLIELRGVHLLRARRAASRQFTIPREVRDRFGIMPLDGVEIIDVRPLRTSEVGGGSVIIHEGNEH